VNAREVKEALYRRHAAVTELDGPGPWTCVEEWANIDFLAFAAWQQPKPARTRHSRIGYEVKVSRGDMRSELLRPMKRAGAVTLCHEFYFATPAGLLNETEKMYVEPEWEPGDFLREPCPVSYGGTETPAFREYPGACHRGHRSHRFIGPLEERHDLYRPTVEVKCDRCEGRGYAAKSRVEREAPTLWIPNDVGLVEVGPRGVTVIRKAPLRTPEPLSDAALHNLVRWVSWRPDPRHLARHALPHHPGQLALA